MTGDEKPRNKWRRLIGIVFSLASLIILTYIAITLITGGDLGLSRLSGFFPGNEPVEMANEFLFDVGRDRVFADLGDFLAAAGTLGIQVLDAGGGETLRDPYRMSVPAIVRAEGRAIAFDIGGTAVRVFNRTEIITSIETSGEIISASINRNGWFCVCIQESGGYRGSVTVYDNRGAEAYRVSLASGYVLSAALSPDNKNLAVLNYTDGGSRVTFYNLNSENADAAFDLPGGLILEIRYLLDNEVLAVTTDSLIVIDKDGESRVFFSFSGRLLGGYSLDGDFIALHLLDYGIGYNGWLVSLSNDGTVCGVLGTDREIISMSVGIEYLAVLRGDGLIFYNSELIEIPQAGEPVYTIGASRVIALDSGAVLVTNDHSAVVCSAAEAAS